MHLAPGTHHANLAKGFKFILHPSAYWVAVPSVLDSAYSDGDLH
jgi:hypothetical protein